MKKTLEFEILISKKIVVEYYCGDIYIDELINLKKDISKEKDYDPNFNIIMDFRDANSMSFS